MISRVTHEDGVPGYVFSGAVEVQSVHAYNGGDDSQTADHEDTQ